MNQRVNNILSNIFISYSNYLLYIKWSNKNNVISSHKKRIMLSWES